jgi:cyd operon protein YbgT
MWYFTWVLGLGFAAMLGVINAMWLEHEITKDGK